MSMVAMARPGAVHHAADGAVELHVREVVLGGLDLGGVLLVDVAKRGDLGMAEQRVVLEDILASRQSRLPSFVTTSGLISIRLASLSMKSL